MKLKRMFRYKINEGGNKIGFRICPTLLSFVEYRTGNNFCESQISCRSGACANASVNCTYDLLDSGYVKGCRDLTHLRQCGMFHSAAFTY